MDKHTAVFLRRCKGFAKRRLGEDAQVIIIKTKQGTTYKKSLADLPPESPDEVHDRKLSADQYVLTLLPPFDKDGMPLESVKTAGGYRNKDNVRRILGRLKKAKKVVEDDVGYKRVP